jgi:hypothetical protein
MLWRQRLPVVGAANQYSEEELAAAIREILSQLGADLTKQLAEPRLLDEFISLLRAGQRRAP